MAAPAHARLRLLAALLVGISVSSAASGQLRLRVSAEAGLGRDVVGAAAHGFSGAAVDLLMHPGVEAGAGLRLLTGGVQPDPVVAGFLQARLAARQGVWSPALGLELELAAAHVAETPGEPGQSLERSFNALGRMQHLRAHMVLSPLRFEFESLLLAAGLLRMGTPLDDAGNRMRIGLTIVQVGWAARP